MSEEYQKYLLGDFKLQHGGELPDAFIAYRTLGNPCLPAIIYPTWFSGLISDNLWLIGPGKTLDPSQYHIIIPALFGNGQSASPSNMPCLRPFPTITFFDNVRAQYELVTKHLGVKHARAVLGWSMGGAQTFQWATQYPDFMDLIVPFCGAARTSLHNQAMLEGVKSALYASRGLVSDGIGKRHLSPDKVQHVEFTEDSKQVGLKALGRVYSSWGFSQAFYRERLYETVLGFKDIEDFMVNFWEAWACSKDPDNMLVMAETWQLGDSSDQEPYNCDFSKAMKGIKAKALVLPAQTDLYFPPEDSAIEVQNMGQGIGTLKVFPSVWGHWAGGPGDSKEDVTWLDEQLRDFFANN